MALSACSSSPSSSDAGPTACDIEATGNLYGAVQVAPCASVSQDADAGGDWVLKIDTSTPVLARIVTTVDLGTAPTTGDLTNDSVGAWDATALSASSSCAFQAGSGEVPNGTLSLSLDAFDAPSKTAHGTLVVAAYLHAPPTIDCGYGDIENITIQF